MFESPLWIIAKQQSNDAAGESHDAGLGREVAMRCFVLGSGVDGNGNMKKDPSGSPKKDPLPGAAEGAGGHRER
jgi:hypothetical protein